MFYMQIFNKNTLFWCKIHKNQYFYTENLTNENLRFKMKIIFDFDFSLCYIYVEMNEYNFSIAYDVTDERLAQAIKIDKQFFMPEEVGDKSTCHDWLSVNKDIYTFLLCNDRVVGYINFMAVGDECYARILSGALPDYEITNADVLPFNVGKNNGLLTSIALDRNFQNGVAVKKLWRGFCNRINELNKQGKHIVRIVMDCVTPIGEKCATNFLKAHYVTKSKHGKIYEVKNFNVDD